jgi:hypothetical protein
MDRKKEERLLGFFEEKRETWLRYARRLDSFGGSERGLEISLEEGFFGDFINFRYLSKIVRLLRGSIW